MRLIMCDSCGKEIENEDAMGTVIVTEPKSNVTKIKKVTTNELCGECIRHIQRYINTKVDGA